MPHQSHSLFLHAPQHTAYCIRYPTAAPLTAHLLLLTARQPRPEAAAAAAAAVCCWCCCCHVWAHWQGLWHAHARHAIRGTPGHAWLLEGHAGRWWGEGLAECDTQALNKGLGGHRQEAWAANVGSKHNQMGEQDWCTTEARPCCRTHRGATKEGHGEVDAMSHHCGSVL